MTLKKLIFGVITKSEQVMRLEEYIANIYVNFAIKSVSEHD